MERYICDPHRYTCVYMHAFIYAHECIHILLQTYICVHMHMYIHIDIHIVYIKYMRGLPVLLQQELCFP